MPETAPQPLWLDDIEVGLQYRTAERLLEADEIIEFARRYDPQPFHLSEEGAVDTLFGTLAASGWHTVAITMRLVVTSVIPIANGIIGASIELAWPTPTRPGDVLHVDLSVDSVTPSLEARPGVRGCHLRHRQSARRGATAHGGQPARVQAPGALARGDHPLSATWHDADRAPVPPSPTRRLSRRFQPTTTTARRQINASRSRRSRTQVWGSMRSPPNPTTASVTAPMSLTCCCPLHARPTPRSASRRQALNQTRFPNYTTGDNAADASTPSLTSGPSARTTSSPTAHRELTAQRTTGMPINREARRRPRVPQPAEGVRA